MAHCRRSFVKAEPNRYIALYPRSYSRKIVRQIRGIELQRYGDHSADDVDADRGGNDRGFRRNDAAAGRAFAKVSVGHDRYVARDYWKTGDVADLVDRARFDREISGPSLNVSNIDFFNRAAHKMSPPFLAEVGAARFELASPCSQGRCADRLRCTPWRWGTGVEAAHLLSNRQATLPGRAS